MANGADPKTTPAPVPPAPPWESQEWERMRDENQKLREENYRLSTDLARADKLHPRATENGQPPFRVKE